MLIKSLYKWTREVIHTEITMVTARFLLGYPDENTVMNIIIALAKKNPTFEILKAQTNLIIIQKKQLIVIRINMTFESY